MPGLISTAWLRGPEQRIWDALADTHCEQIQESAVPGPILKILTMPLIDNKEITTKRRFFRVGGKLGDSRNAYMLLPDDTAQHETVISDSDWLNKREPSWVAIKHMSPEEVEVRVAQIVFDLLKRQPTPFWIQDRHKVIRFVGKTMSPESLRVGLPGLDIAEEVFNWTALEYDDALGHTARRLWKMLLHGEIRRLEDDRWMLSSKYELLHFMQAGADGMNSYDRFYGNPPRPWTNRELKKLVRKA